MLVLNSAPLPLNGQLLFQNTPLAGASQLALQQAFNYWRSAPTNSVSAIGGMAGFYTAPTTFSGIASPVSLGEARSDAVTLEKLSNDPLGDEYREEVNRNVEKAKSDPAFADLPANLREFLGYAHVGRITGEKNNPLIMDMAKELADHKGVPNTFKDDEPWCALFINYMGLKLSQKGTNKSFDYPADFSHKAYPEKFGEKIEFNDRRPGDFLFFYNEKDKNDLQHAGRLVKEDSESYYVFGGNQGNSEVSITKIPKTKTPRDIRRWPGSEDGTADLKWDDKSPLSQLLDSTGNPIKRAAVLPSAANSDKAVSPPSNGVAVFNADTPGYKVGMVFPSGSKIVAVEKVQDTSSAFAAAPVLKITIKAKDGQLFTKYCEPPLDSTKTDSPNKTKVVKEQVKLDAAKSKVLPKMADAEDGDGGKVTWQGFKALLEESGKLITEDGVKRRLYNPETKEFVGEEFTDTSHGYCNPEHMSGMTVLRYTHWDQILKGIGLGKYAGKFRPPGYENSHEYNGMRFDEFVPKLMTLIRKDHPEAKTEYEALLAATKSDT